MRVSVTRHETVERHWECARCDARGVVILRAIGESGWKQVWLSRDAAEADATEDARWAVQRDADRMLGMIRCPSCRHRAPGVYAWAVLRNLIPVGGGLLFGGAFALLLILLGYLPFWTAPLFMVAGVVIALLPERRRWLEARDTTVRELVPGDPQKVALVRAKTTEAAMPKATARELPPKRAESLAPVVTHAPRAVDRPSDAEGPRFLRDKP